MWQCGRRWAPLSLPSCCLATFVRLSLFGHLAGFFYLASVSLAAQLGLQLGLSNLYQRQAMACSLSLIVFGYVWVAGPLHCWPVLLCLVLFCGLLCLVRVWLASLGSDWQLRGIAGSGGHREAMAGNKIIACEFVGLWMSGELMELPLS